MINIPRRKQKIKYSRKQACKYLEPKGDISNCLQPLCNCVERELVLGTKAFVCETCYLYNPKNNVKISDVYEESRKLAEARLKERKIEIIDILKDEDIDLSIDEFEEDEGELPTKFEKRKADKGDMEDSEDFAEIICPFCDEIVDDLRSHIESCEFAPEDASIEDIMPSRPKKKKKGKKASTTPSKKPKEGEEEGGAQKCPYCGKEFQRLGRHLNSCKKKPADDEEEEEEDEDDEEEEEEDEDDDEEDDDDDDFDED
ncbi:MAG: hypothetical protein ACFFBP_03650 [Promethearchaeota archaeon]